VRKGFVWLVVLLLVAVAALLVGPPLLAIFTGGGVFDPG